jgi:uncharacterized membrane protein YcaP (DUF421 family)
MILPLKKRASFCRRAVLSFDNVIIIMLGSIFSRVVIGASPFVPTTLACFAFVLVHRVLALISFYNDRVGSWIKGEASSLYANGEFNEANMRKARVTSKTSRKAYASRPIMTVSKM